MTEPPLLEVRDLRTYFRTHGGTVRAADGVSFQIREGQTLGIVGESGSGKSVTALSLLQLNPSPPAYYPTGQILLDGTDILTTPRSQLRDIRGNDIAMVFQDPLTSLNPVMTIGRQITETVRLHQNVPRKEAHQRAIEVLQDVGIPRPADRLDDYPHQFSGGMRQRAMIAIALSCSPRLLIADELTTALDVTVQAQILELLRRLQDKYGMAIILITHDLGVVARLAHQLMVMYAGRVVEHGSSNDVFYRPLMPYTWALLQAVPRTDQPLTSRLPAIPGSPPSLTRPPASCPFHPRCPFARPECTATRPELEEKDDAHRAACILDPDEIWDLQRRHRAQPPTRAPRPDGRQRR